MKRGMLFEAVAILLLILLAFLLYVMITGGAPSSGQWSIPGFGASNGEAGSMFIGPDNVLYVVSGNRVNAVSADGHILWETPLNNSTQEYNAIWVGDQAAFDNGTIYLLLRHGNKFFPMGRELIAMSDKGELLWDKQLGLDTFTINPRDTSIAAGGRQLYLHTGDIETVYDREGNVRWHLSDINAGLSVDPNGDLYVMPGDGTLTVVDAYRPDGSLKWEYRLGNDSFSQEIGGNAGVTYDNHTIYAALKKGFIALDENGSLLWKKELDGDYVSMHMIGGTWYVYHGFNQAAGGYTSILGRDGNETRVTGLYVPGTMDTIAGNMLIHVGSNGNPDNRSLSGLNSYRIEAYDIKSGNKLWNNTIIPIKTYNTTLNESNVNDVMFGTIGPGGYGDSWDAIQTNMLTPRAWYEEHSLPYGYEEIKNFSIITETPWDGGIYVSYWAYNYEYPFFFDRSRCVYAGGLYAFDKNGMLLWAKPTDSEVTTVVANNGTVYFDTKSGRLSAGNPGIAAGFALTAAFYLFARFLLAGAVTRARGLVDKNRNRSNVLKYIADNPGSSLYEIARSLQMNLGTVRYHLMILGVNHRIVSCKADDKYVRYFTNAGSYSPEQQLIVSLMRRDGIKKVLCLLLRSPGMSNAELSTELGMQESAASRYMIELLELGVVTREQVIDGTLSYYIKSEFKGPIAFAADRLKC